MKPVIVVGGGLSGLAAGVRLTSRGIPVLLLEQKATLGGRVSSFVDAKTGDVVDNGQHLLIAGYKRTLAFLQSVGALDRVKIQRRPEILFHHPQRGFRRLRLPLLPSPLHLAVGILRCDLFTLQDRWAILRGGAAVRRVRGMQSAADADLTVKEWLIRRRQSAESICSFWEPLAVSIMNERIDVASAHVFLHSIADAFLGSPLNAAMAIPTVGLTDLFVRPAETFLRQGGAEIRPSADVVGLGGDGETITGVRLRDGSELSGRAVILAVPSNKIAALLPPDFPGRAALQKISETPASPIVSVHVWHKEDIMPQNVVGLIGGCLQWVFNKRKIIHAPGRSGGFLSAVISAAYDVVDLESETILGMALDDLKRLFGPPAGAVTHALIIKEKRATFSLTPSVEQLRPDQKTGIRHVYLAGDWTATGYPATIEGAIQSGERCANLLVDAEGRAGPATGG